MKNSSIMRIGLLKVEPEPWNLEKNLTLFEEALQTAAARNVNLLCTPECFLDGYAASDTETSNPTKLLEISQSLDHSNYLSRVSELAKQYSMGVVFGFTERGEQGIYNSAAYTIDRDILR